MDLNRIENMYVDLNNLFDGDSSIVYDIINDIKKPRHVIVERNIFYCCRYLVLENDYRYNTVSKISLGDRREVSFNEFCNHIKVGNILNVMGLMRY